jgi:hypothetical protein
MIVPEFWSEARQQRRQSGRQITVRRFGWSDESPEAAARHAEERVAEAMRRIVGGEPLPRREKKVGYAGADGLPIREEIVERMGDQVITRNSYGARCLNSPDVFFADIDYPAPWERSCRYTGAVLVGSLMVAIAVGIYLQRAGPTMAVLLLLPVVLLCVAELLVRIRTRLAGGTAQLALGRIERFLARHPAWHVRVYRTPNGLRLLAMHQTFDPRSEEVAEAFRVLGVDPVYQLMCQKQNCFRARLTAKPWRIGIREHLRPVAGVWPVKDKYLPARRDWIARYETTAANYAACEFVTSLGSMRIHEKIRSLCDYHDQQCNANRQLTIA